jgi:hypothetical protein
MDMQIGATQNSSLIEEYKKRFDWLSDFADLLDGAKNLMGHGYYSNKKQVTGYYACFQSTDRNGFQYLMISRHNTHLNVAKQEMVEELR